MPPERRNWGKVTPSSQSSVYRKEPEKFTHKEMWSWSTELSAPQLLWGPWRHSGSWKVLFFSGFQTSLHELHCCSPSGVKWLILWNDIWRCGYLKPLFSVCFVIKCARNILSHLLAYILSVSLLSIKVSVMYLLSIRYNLSIICSSIVFISSIYLPTSHISVTYFYYYLSIISYISLSSSQHLFISVICLSISSIICLSCISIIF